MPELPNRNRFSTDFYIPMSYKRMLSSSVPITGTPPIYIDSDEPGIVDFASLKIIEAQFSSFKGKKPHIVYSSFQEIVNEFRWHYSFGELDYPEEEGSHRRFARIMVEELVSGLSMAQLVYARNDVENGLRSEFRMVGEDGSALIAAAEFEGNKLGTIAIYTLPTALYVDDVFFTNMESGNGVAELSARLRDGIDRTRSQLDLITRQHGTTFSVVVPKHTDQANTDRMYNFLFSGTEFSEDTIDIVTPDTLGFEMHLSTRQIG